MADSINSVPLLNQKHKYKRTAILETFLFFMIGIRSLRMTLVIDIKKILYSDIFLKFP